MFEEFKGKKVKIVKYDPETDGKEVCCNFTVFEVDGPLIKVEGPNGEIQGINMLSPLNAEIEIVKE